MSMEDINTNMEEDGRDIVRIVCSYSDSSRKRNNNIIVKIEVTMTSK